MSTGTGDLITRMYGNFRGVDFRGEEVNLSRSPDSVNMWKDYRETESIRTRPNRNRHSPIADVSFDLTLDVSKFPVYGMIAFDDALVVHQGYMLEMYYLTYHNGSTKRILYDDMNYAKSVFFVCGDNLYVMDGKNYLVVAKNTFGRAEKVTPYIPTTSIGKSGMSGGSLHEDVNLLTDRRINTFRGDGVTKDFALDMYIDDPDTIPSGDFIVTVNGQPKRLAADYTYFRTDDGMFGISFNNNKIPPAPYTDGQDNISVEFTAVDWSIGQSSGNMAKILECKLVQVFDNRIFVSGNPKYPNMVWHSSLNNPAYFSDLDYYREGLDEANVTGLVAGNNALWVFREPSDNNTTIFYHSPSIDPDYGTIYPSVHSSISTGCIGKAINFNDDIVFFSNRGMEGVSGDVTTEQAVSHRSSLVDRKLMSEENYKSMILKEWGGYLLVMIDNKIYLADSRAKFNNTDHYEYEWFYWEFKNKIVAAEVYDGDIYLAFDDNSLYRLDDTEYDTLTEYYRGYEKVTSRWVTAKDKFNALNKLKTTNKRGCVVEATGDIKLSVKTEATDFEPIGTYEKVTDYFVSRIKRKKWKDIQLKFESETSFTLETATLESFVGGYIKR